MFVLPLFDIETARLLCYPSLLIIMWLLSSLLLLLLFHFLGCASRKNKKLTKSSKSGCHPAVDAPKQFICNTWNFCLKVFWCKNLAIGDLRGITKYDSDNFQVLLLESNMAASELQTCWDALFEKKFRAMTLKICI